MQNLNELRGKTALITGASSGIGAAVARAFARLGAYVIVHYNSQKEQASDLLNNVQQTGGQGELLQANLATRDGTQSLIAALEACSIDILINNAGSLIRRTRTLEFTCELWDQMMMLNLTSAFLLARAVLPGMIERRSGFIVNISSVAARNGGGLGAIAYATAKAGISSMTRSLAKEFAPLGIRVNAVSPGTIDTNYHRTFSNQQALEAVKAATPMGRLGTPEEVADVVVFLCSEGARFIQGQTVEVNGGFLMV